ncbi:MAG: DUF4303 domain-containing protein [Gemmataceae bacterium]|nr:DUF4303 domain-containing protein [Gemmataceae bacterium]
MLEGLDFSDLREKVSKQVEAFLTKCRTKAPDETFYGLAICIDGDVTSLVFRANSEQSLEHSGDRFFIDDWPCTDKKAADANKALTALWEQFRTEIDSSEASDDARRAMRKRCLETLVNGLRDFRRLAATSISADFGLFVYDPDPEVPGEALQIAKFLNSPATYEAFADPDNGCPFA